MKDWCLTRDCACERGVKVYVTICTSYFGYLDRDSVITSIDRLSYCGFSNPKSHLNYRVAQETCLHNMGINIVER